MASIDWDGTLLISGVEDSEDIFSIELGGMPTAIGVSKFIFEACTIQQIGLVKSLQLEPNGWKFKQNCRKVPRK